jgi:hypothetical protein
VGSIGVVFQRLKLRGLLDQFKVDHKQFATNEYLNSHSANFYMLSFLPMRNLLPTTRSIWNKSVKIHMPNSSRRSRSNAETDLRPMISPFQEKSSTAKKPSSKVSSMRLAPSSKSYRPAILGPSWNCNLSAVISSTASSTSDHIMAKASFINFVEQISFSF